MARRPRKYRLWIAEEKRSICAQTQAPGVSVAQVARRYSMNANLIFKWLKDPRYAPEDILAAPPPIRALARNKVLDPRPLRVTQGSSAQDRLRFRS